MTIALTLNIDANYLSPYALAAFVAAHQKGLSLAIKNIDLAGGEQRQAAYAAKALNRRVPSIEIDGFYLSESSAICEYLEERFAPPAFAALYPDDIQQRARARQIQAWLRSDLAPLRQERNTEVVFVGPCSTPLSEAARGAANKLVSAASSLIAEGQTQLFDRWCIADTDLAVMLKRLAYDTDLLPTHLLDYAQAQWQHPGVQAWLVRRAEHLGK